jgi:ribosomal protein S11
MFALPSVPYVKVIVFGTDPTKEPFIYKLDVVEVLVTVINDQTPAFNELSELRPVAL